MSPAIKLPLSKIPVDKTSKHLDQSHSEGILVAGFFVCTLPLWVHNPEETLD